MARRRIYLMRHGDVQYFVTDREPAASQSVELTERGREQARAAGRALRTVRFDRVITSGLDRVIETARIVLDTSDHADQPEIETWPEFEEFRVSHLADLAEHEVDAAFFTVFHSATPDREMSYLFGENVGSLLDRVNIELDRLIADESWKRRDRRRLSRVPRVSGPGTSLITGWHRIGPSTPWRSSRAGARRRWCAISLLRSATRVGRQRW